MTENEAKEILSLSDDMKEKLPNLKEVYEVAVNALEEIQQYRALVTVEEVKCAMKYLSLAKKHGTIGQVIDSCAEYESLGTVEELQEAMEKQEAKKPETVDYDYSYYVGPACGEGIYSSDDFESHHYCLNCGQAIDWSEEE